MLQIFGKARWLFSHLTVFPWSTIAPVALMIIVLAYREGINFQKINNAKLEVRAECNEGTFKQALDAEVQKNIILERENKLASVTLQELNQSKKDQEKLLKSLQAIASDIQYLDGDLSPRTLEFIKQIKKESDVYYENK